MNIFHSNNYAITNHMHNRQERARCNRTSARLITGGVRLNLVMLLIVLAAGVASSHSPRFRLSSTGPPRLSETGRLPQRTQALQRLRGGIILAEELQLCLNLLEAAVLGSVIGVERGWAGRPAGIRTMSMVCMGAALFTGVASSRHSSSHSCLTGT